MGLKTLNKDIQKPIKPGPKKTLNFRALSPPTRNPNAHEALPPRGHTLTSTLNCLYYYGSYTKVVLNSDSY